jgi:hypothetical protein
MDVHGKRLARTLFRLATGVERCHLTKGWSLQLVQQFLVDDLERCVANGVTIIKPITPTEWGTKDFYV